MPRTITLTLPDNVLQPVLRVAQATKQSVEERYLSKEDYLGRVQQAAEALVQQGYLLAEDLSTVTEQASQRYDLFRGQVSGEKA